jgi:hypothetical protein
MSPAASMKARVSLFMESTPSTVGIPLRMFRKIKDKFSGNRISVRVHERDSPAKISEVPDLVDKYHLMFRRCVY